MKHWNAHLERYLKEHTNPPVFLISGAIVLAFLIAGSAMPARLGNAAEFIHAWITQYFGWFYALTANVFLVVVIVLAIGRFGRIRLGPDDARPTYSKTAWFAMLFTAGMGIGLVYFGVAEPLAHFSNPPMGEGNTKKAALTAINWTFYHWGLHAWGIYIVLGLAMAYFTFRQNLPLRPAAAFYPLIGERIYGPIGNLVDILAVFGTLYGLATSLGIGANQIGAGLDALFRISNTVDTQIVIILLIEAVAITSVMLGVNRGIRNLSLVNLWLSVILMLAVFVAGPTMYLLNALPEYLGYHLQNLVGTSLTSFTSSIGNGQAAQWQASWTLFYWGWWISWSPFVGMFIARISYGRTVRQFVLGALLAPVGASFVWFTVFGGSALHHQLYGAGSLAGAGADEAIFKLIDGLSFGPTPGLLVSGLAIVVVTLFFATSSDSGSLVVDMLTNGGDPNPIRLQRFFWAVTEGLIAIVLLQAGGVQALQTAAIITSLPFALVLLLMCYALIRVARRSLPR